MTNAGTPGDVIAATNWQRVDQRNKARGGAEIQGITGTGTTLLLGIQTATDPRNPDSGYTGVWASGATGNGIKDPDSTLASVSMAGKLWWRWVWVIYTSSGTGWAHVSGFGELMDQG